MAGLRVFGLLLLIVVAANGTRLRDSERRAKERGWWFTGWTSDPKPAPKAVEKPVEAAPERTVATVKEQVVQSEAFHKKVLQLCNGVAKEDEKLCFATAADRMFCAMFARQSSKFADLPGAKEESEHCTSLDTMENSKEAAEDLKVELERRQEAREDSEATP